MDIAAQNAAIYGPPTVMEEESESIIPPGDEQNAEMKPSTKPVMPFSNTVPKSASRVFIVRPEPRVENAAQSPMAICAKLEIKHEARNHPAASE